MGCVGVGCERETPFMRDILKHHTVIFQVTLINPLYTSGLFQHYMLDESICHLGVSGLFCHFNSIFDRKSFEQTV